jgi:ribosomal protein S18 acetylase RimI-like enzyme
MTTLISLRNGQPADFEKITSVMPLWWNGRDLTAAILKVFFHHFNDTIFIAEQNNTMVGFLIGFLSQSDPDVGYIHFAGVHPDFRKIGVARQLYNQFY